MLCMRVLYVFKRVYCAPAHQLKIVVQYHTESANREAADSRTSCGHRESEKKMSSRLSSGSISTARRAGGPQLAAVTLLPTRVAYRMQVSRRSRRSHRFRHVAHILPGNCMGLAPLFGAEPDVSSASAQTPMRRAVGATQRLGCSPRAETTSSSASPEAGAFDLAGLRRRARASRRATRVAASLRLGNRPLPRSAAGGAPTRRRARRPPRRAAAAYTAAARLSAGAREARRCAGRTPARAPRQFRGTGQAGRPRGRPPPAPRARGASTAARVETLRPAPAGRCPR